MRRHQPRIAIGSGANDARYYPALDGMRAIAIIGVLCLHYLVRTPALPTPFGHALYEFVRHGFYGVDLFFVLSGFLITGILLDTRDSPSYFRTFYLRRALRIFPLYYTALLLIGLVLPVLLPSAFGFARNTSLSVAWFWTYLANWPLALHGWGVSPPALPHFWTLAVEEQFYLVWPTLVLFVGARRLVPTCVLLVVTATILRALFIYRWPVLNNPHLITPLRLDGLAVGAVVGVWWHSPKNVASWRWAVWPSVWMSLAAIVGMAFWRGTLLLEDRAIFIIGLPLIVTFFAAVLAAVLLDGKRSPLSRALSVAPLKFIGRYSYAIYILHYPILVAFNAMGLTMAVLMPHTHSVALAEAIIFGVNAVTTLSCALASWHLLEKRFLRLKSRFPYQPPHVSAEAAWQPKAAEGVPAA